MPRTFWYHVAITCILSLGTAAIVAGRGSYEENALYHLFYMPESSLSPPAFLCTFALVGVTALLGVRISGISRPMGFIALYAIVLFAPLLYLATHSWTDTLSLLVLVLSIRFLLEPDTGVKALVIPLFLLLAAIVLRGQLAAAALAFPAYLLAARRGKSTLQFIILFALSYAALFSLDLGAIDRVRAFFPPPAAGNGIAIESILALFRNSIEFQLILGFTPFVLAAAVGLTMREFTQDRSALFLILILFLISLLLFPASVSDPGTARLLYMLLSLFTILGANSGILLLAASARGPRALRWSVVLAILFLLPALASFI